MTDDEIETTTESSSFDESAKSRQETRASLLLRDVLGRVALIVLIVQLSIQVIEPFPLGAISIWLKVAVQSCVLTLVISLATREWVIRPLIAQLDETMSELAQARDSAEQLARTDSLTGLLNRRAFMKLAERELSMSARTAQSVSCVMLDLDYFKQVNDSFGHLAGDAVLQAVAEELQVCGREYDLVCRYGGEEFCIVLPNTPESGAASVAERLRHAVAEQRFDKTGEGLSITASFGVAEWSGPTDELVDIIDRADQALLRAKKAGRNCVCTASQREADVRQPECEVQFS